MAESATAYIGSSVTTPLQDMLMAEDIAPGAEPDYQLCKTIYVYHPLGAKMVEAPIVLAMAKPREITVPNSPESVVVEAFRREWKELQCDDRIFNLMRTKRIYGVASAILGIEGKDPSEPVDWTQIHKERIFFNVLDPLNTSGSIVLNQDPNAADFQKPRAISVQGKQYSMDRAIVAFNEDPIYIQYSTSGFGYVGRSVYQRALFPLKSYIQSLITNDMVLQKAGVIIAKLTDNSSMMDRLAQWIKHAKIKLLKMATAGNVIYIGEKDEVSTLDLQNVDDAITAVRKNVIEDIASSAPIPPKLLLADSFASVLANGTEDYKELVLYLQRFQQEMQPLYDFFDRIVMYRAWNPDFYATVQQQFPEAYGKMPYTQAFYQWRNSFTATFRSLMEEPESEQIKVDDVRFKAMIGLLEALIDRLDPINRSRFIEWLQDNINVQKRLFDSPLDLDIEAFAEYEPPTPATPEGMPRESFA